MTSIKGLSISDLKSEVAAPDKNRKLPSTKRILHAEGIDLISFSFLPGQVLSEHRAPHPITVHCIEGTVDFHIENEKVPMPAGTLIHLDKGIAHTVSCTKEASTILVSLLIGAKKPLIPKD